MYPDRENSDTDVYSQSRMLSLGRRAITSITMTFDNVSCVVFSFSVGNRIRIHL
jgi:hypothetical protein